MSQAPRDPAEPILPSNCWWAIFSYATLIMVPVLASFWLATFALGSNDEEAVTVSFLTLAFARLWHIFNMRSLRSTIFHNEITGNRYVWAALLLCTGLLTAAAYVPGISGVLSLSGPGPAEWGLVAILSLMPLAVGQTVKTLRQFVTPLDRQDLYSSETSCLRLCLNERYDRFPLLR